LCKLLLLVFQFDALHDWLRGGRWGEWGGRWVGGCMKTREETQANNQRRPLHTQLHIPHRQRQHRNKRLSTQQERALPLQIV
jgi:hypothetical protein